MHILGVNQVGQESANDLMCQGRDLPWLQETVDVQVWNVWRDGNNTGVRYRDVVVLDGENRWVATFNLTDFDLMSPANFDSLKTLLLETGP